MLKKYNIKSAALAFVIGAVFAAPVLSQAGVETKPSGKETKPVEAIKESFITGDLGNAVVSSYISRGGVNENQGFIDQPYLDIYCQLYKGDGFVNKISLNLGFWASLHSEKTAAAPGSSLSAWYEFDWMPGISVTFLKNFTATLTWLDFDFVSSGARAGSLSLNLGYDDTDLLGAFALHPHFTVIKTMIGNLVGVPNSDLGWYYEVGIAPGYSFFKGEAYPLTFTVPLTVGLGPESYNGETYGFFSAGINMAVPLTFIPSGYGNWTATAGFTYWNIGDAAAQAYTPGIISGDNSQFVFSGSIGMTF